MNHGTFGSIAYAAKLALELCTGNLDRAGGALVIRGAIDLARLAARLGFDREPSVTSRIGGFSPVMGALPTGILADEILTPGPEQVRALIVIGGNPLLSAPDGARMRQALASLDTLVCLDLFVTDTAAHASHVLPCTDFLERDDFPLAFLQLQPDPYVQWTDAVVPAREGRRPEWRIISDLCGAAKLPLGGRRVVDALIRTALALGGPKRLIEPLLVPRFGLRPLAFLRRHPHGLRMAREAPGDFLARRIATPSGKVKTLPDRGVRPSSGARGDVGRTNVRRASLDQQARGAQSQQLVAREPATAHRASRRSPLSVGCGTTRDPGRRSRALVDAVREHRARRGVERRHLPWGDRGPPRVRPRARQRVGGGGRARR